MIDFYKDVSFQSFAYLSWAASGTQTVLPGFFLHTDENSGTFWQCDLKFTWLFRSSATFDGGRYFVKNDQYTYLV